MFFFTSCSDADVFILPRAKGELFPYLTLLDLRFRVHLGLIEHCLWPHGRQTPFLYSGAGGCMLCVLPGCYCVGVRVLQED